MSTHRDQFVHGQFKRHAKELTHIIVEKERKSASYREGRLDALLDEKAGKVKKFAKEDPPQGGQEAARGPPPRPVVRAARQLRVPVHAVPRPCPVRAAPRRPGGVILRWLRYASTLEEQLHPP
ncbi:uncharacterized protein B0H18DRAFT_1124100 [Fomitopsis serialis]|uniref:uncharacterized protein n=1 Tax=Fomitopsis serialis TaxID=139415 RepID=UPI0020082067|nr:uncharacterized protein B0H18DRAFT_1124100 [Neoantrodia serialis]KAH9916685.1 hypothetical protein B0H18DRAFT_1124100 [Neoantrodia serialis]